MKDSKLGNIVAALSLANIFFFPVWRRLIYPSDPSYNIKYLPDAREYLTLIFTVVLLAAAFYLGLAVARRIGSKAVVAAKVIFLGIVAFVFLILGIMVIKTQFWIVPLIGRNVLKVFGLLIGLSAIVFCSWRYKHLVRYARAAMLILSPLIFITFSQALIFAFSSHPQTHEVVLAKDPVVSPSLNRSIRSRVVWIIFDEMDYRLAFESRPEGIDLPEFDRLKSESIHTTNAHAPSRSTLTSIPSLMIGRKAVKAETAGPRELLLTFENSNDAEKFGEEETIFSEVRKMGGRTAVVGWYHPYCRVIPQHFDECYWETFDDLKDFPADTVPAVIWGDFIRVVNTLPHEIRDKITMNGEYVRRHNEMMTEARRFVSDPNLDLVFIHLPVPHYPVVYDRQTGEFTGGNGYADNLVLADRMLSDLREQMEKAGLWEVTAVLVSSDHQFRIRDNISAKDRRLIGGTEDTRVPFLLKLPNSHEPIEIAGQLKTLVTHDLIEMLVRRGSGSPQEVADWLRSWKPK